MKKNPPFSQVYDQWSKRKTFNERFVYAFMINFYASDIKDQNSITLYYLQSIKNLYVSILHKTNLAYLYRITKINAELVPDASV